MKRISKYTALVLIMGLGQGAMANPTNPNSPNQILTQQTPIAPIRY